MKPKKPVLKPQTALFDQAAVPDYSAPQVEQAEVLGLSPAQPPGCVLAGENQTLAQVLPVIEPDRVYHVASSGLWSMHDLVLHLLSMTGPARVTLATWSMSETAVRQLVAALIGGQITQLTALFDGRIRVRNPEVFEFLRYNTAHVRTTSNHAKVTVIENDAWSVACVSSANLTNNPRYEATVIDTHPEAARFHRRWIAREHGAAHELRE
jgi:hypothetical protein